ncbi:hypothetical protein OIU78_024395 [Salix suchowensis]|nr:hypothetical protein OIU78_024395 [Salix suchowensis]
MGSSYHREDNSWRPLFPNLQRCGTEKQKSPGPMVVTAGLAVHCVSIIEFCSRFVAELVSFDLESETFTTVVLPHRLFSDWRKVWAINWNGFLAFASRLQENLNVMMLEEYKNMNWVKEKITVPLSFLKNRNGNDSIEDLVPLAAKSGELWFWLKTNEIIGCDLETMKITATVSADAERDNTRVRFYRGPPVLVTLKGMRSYR